MDNLDDKTVKDLFKREALRLKESFGEAAAWVSKIQKHQLELKKIQAELEKRGIKLEDIGEVQ